MTQISFTIRFSTWDTTVILMPFSGYIIKFAMKVNGLKAVETKSDEAELVHLDKRMMSTPSVAVEGAKAGNHPHGAHCEREPFLGTLYAF